MTHVTCRLTAKNRDQLRNHTPGNRVWTTFFICWLQSATIYFSDIADFVDISADAEPMELVNLLNSVYGLIDSQIGAYDVYKVYANRLARLMPIRFLTCPFSGEI